MTMRLYIHQPEVLFAARVNQAVFTYPLDEITFDTVTTGAAGNVGDGMTLLLGSTAGADDLGRQRVKSTTSTLIRIGRSSRGTRDGELDVVDNAHITILGEFRVWAKIPYIDEDGDIFKDGTTGAASGDLSGNVTDPPPIANAGAAMAGTIDSVTGLLTVEFDGSESRQFDAAVSSALTTVAEYLWEVDDGTITVGTTTSAAITATFPAGFRYVWLTVSSDAGKFHTARIAVFARDPEDDDSTANFQISGHSITPQGQELAVRVLDEIPRATYPDGALILVWEGEPSDGADRSHMQFVGWHQRDEAVTRASATGSLRDTVLHCVDVVGRLKTLPGFGQRLEAIEAPSEWYHTRYPNVFYYLHYLLHWHSTALSVADLLLGTQILNNFEFKSLASDADNLYNQVNDMAQLIRPDHHLTCNVFGQMLLVVNPQIQHVPDRSSTIALTLTDALWSEIRFGYQRPPRVHRLISKAIDNNVAVATAIAAIAPGIARGQGEIEVEIGNGIADGQGDLNDTEGNRYAHMNAPYGPLTIVYPWTNLNTALREAVARLMWVRLTVASENQPQRTLPFTNQRGLVQEISIAYQYERTGLVRTATITWEVETSGPAAATLELEDEEEA